MDFSLDALLDESVQLAKARLQLRRGKERITGFRTGTPVEQEAYRKAELQANWTPVFRVEFWNQLTCDCGCQMAYFDREAVEFHSQGHGKRWTEALGTESEKNLPLKRIRVVTELNSCDMCEADKTEYFIEEEWKA